MEWAVLLDVQAHKDPRKHGAGTPCGTHVPSAAPSHRYKLVACQIDTSVLSTQTEVYVTLLTHLYSILMHSIVIVLSPPAYQVHQIGVWRVPVL